MPLTNSKDCNSYLRNIWEYNTLDYEERVYAVFLDSHGVRIDYELINEGRYSECDLEPKHVKRIVEKAFTLRAKFIVLAHNHPCGDPQPSKADISRTARLNNVLEELDITLVDHLILVKENNVYYSFKDAGLLCSKYAKAS